MFHYFGTENYVALKIHVEVFVMVPTNLALMIPNLLRINLNCYEPIITNNLCK